MSVRGFFRRYLRLRWHVQNLNERKDGACGPIWRHGRAWFHPFVQTDEEAEKDYRPGLCIGVAWTIPTHFFHLYFEKGGYDDPDMSVGIACGLFAFWLHLENLVPKRFQRFWDRYTQRKFGIEFHHGGVWWQVWVNDDEWSEKTPKWRQGNFYPMDFLFGSQVCTTRILMEPVLVKIPMPEGEYEATAKIEERTWKRARWPKVVRRVSVDLDLPNPPKFAGKGENSWDQGDDGIYGIGFDGEDIQAACLKYVERVLEYREKRGMPQELEGCL